MTLSRSTLTQIGTTAAYIVQGLVGTAVVVLGVLYVAGPIQPLIYDLFYLQVGPSEATETAILTHFLVAGILGLSVSMLVGDYLSDRGANLRALGWAAAALVAILLVFFVLALAHLAAFLTALGVLAVGLIGLPIWLRFRMGVRSGGLQAFIGGIPVVILLLLLAGFGLGWGWGYVMVVEEVPSSSVNDPVADFADVPEVRDDLLAADCSTDPEERRTCIMYLRGYEHEVRATRFMARHGVRCPYQNGGGPSGSFVAEDGGMYYRISCSPHGD